MRYMKACIILVNIFVCLCLFASCTKDDKADNQAPEGSVVNGTESDATNDNTKHIQDCFSTSSISVTILEETDASIFPGTTNAWHVSIDEAPAYIFEFENMEATERATSMLSSDGSQIMYSDGNSQFFTDFVPIHWFMYNRELLLLYSGDISKVQEISKALGSQIAGYADSFSAGMSFDTTQLVAEGNAIKRKTSISLASKIDEVVIALETDSWSKIERPKQFNPDIQLDFMNGTVVEFASSENTARAIVQEQDGVRDIWYSVATNIPADVINIINSSPFVATN